MTPSPNAATPFDPNNPFDMASEAIRRSVSGAIVKAIRRGRLPSMGQGDMASAILAGSLTAVVGAMFAITTEDSRDEIMKVIADTLPFAQMQAESIIKDGRNVQ